MNNTAGSPSDVISILGNVISALENKFGSDAVFPEAVQLLELREHFAKQERPALAPLTHAPARSQPRSMQTLFKKPPKNRLHYLPFTFISKSSID